jgi:hypothetical protein
MDIPKLLDALACGIDIEVEITGFPEGCSPVAETVRDGLFESLHCAGKRLPLGFAEEQVNVLGHDDISMDLRA